MASHSTQFNPFGDRLTEIGDLKTKIQKIAENFEKEAIEGGRISSETRSIAQVFEKLGQVAKEIDESAVKPLLSELSSPLSHFLLTLSTKSEKFTKPDVGFLNRCTAKLIGAIADKMTEPFTSDHLKEWAPILEALAVGKGLKESGVVLWKATFANVKGKLEYPGNLRETLQKMTTRKLYLPPDESSTISRNPSFDDDEEAMDGIFPTTSDAPSAPESSEFSQILSQQPEADELAEKLLKEQKKQKEVQKEQKTPPRRRASRMPNLLDEDSCDFVAITTTPTSSKKARLTDRQKEKLAEAAGPRTTINYVDEESQSGFAKTEQWKAALTAMNFDVGEESVSAPTLPVIKSTELASETAEIPPKSEEQASEVVDEPMDTNEKPEAPLTRTTRARKSLFEEKPKILETSEGLKEIQKATEGQKDSEVLVEDVDVEGELEKMPKMTETSSVKRNGRVKKTPKQCLPDRTPPPKKRLRSSAKKEDLEEEVPESKSPEAKMSKIEEESEEKADSEDVVAPEDVKHSEDVKVAEDKTDAEEKKDSDATAPEVVVTTSESQNSESVDEEVKDSDGSQELSPPKTPRTPSILRTRKEGNMTPLTERKKNRVHFPVELPNNESRSNPATPRRHKSSALKSTDIVLAVDVKSPEKPSESFLKEPSEPSDSSESQGLLEISDPFSSTSPFFKGLVGCNDPIERVVRKLAPINLKAAFDNVRRSLQAANIKTVGEFASLTKKQINEMSGIKNPKEKSARTVLAEYEKDKLKEAVREEEERIRKVKAEEDVVDKSDKDGDISDKDVKMDLEEQLDPITDNKDQEPSDKSRESSPPLQPLPMLISRDSDGESQDSQDSDGSVESLDDKKISDKKPDEVIRKNLAPIFEKNRVIKSEILSPPTTIPRVDSEQQKIIKDFHNLQNVISRLSLAHILNTIPSDIWTAHMDIISKSAILYQSIVQKHGIHIEEWDDNEWENSEITASAPTPESDLKTLRTIFRKISRCEACGKVDVETWRHVMHTVSEAATFLENVVKQRGQKA